MSLSYSAMASETSYTKSGVRHPIEKLNKLGFLDVDDDVSPFLYTKTRAGQAIVQSSEKSGGVSRSELHGQLHGSDSEDSGVTSNVHDLAYELPLSEDTYILRKNTETILKKYRQILEYDEESEQYYGDWDRFHFRISGDKVVIYQRGEEYGVNPTYIKNQAIEDMERCREWLSENLNLKFQDHRVIQGRVMSQDLALEDHPVVRAATNAGFDVKAENFHVKDSEGNVRFKLDQSHGEDGELESSMRGQYSSDARMEESDIQNELDDLLWKAENREEWEKVKKYGKDREAIFSAISILLQRELKESESSEDDTSGSERDSYDSPVQELFMRYLDDPEYKKPFFHKDTGGLYAFYTDDSGCKKILSGDDVERLS